MAPYLWNTRPSPYWKRGENQPHSLSLNLQLVPTLMLIWASVTKLSSSGPLQINRIRWQLIRLLSLKLLRIIGSTYLGQVSSQCKLFSMWFPGDLLSPITKPCGHLTTNTNTVNHSGMIRTFLTPSSESKLNLTSATWASWTGEEEQLTPTGSSAHSELTTHSLRFGAALLNSTWTHRLASSAGNAITTLKNRRNMTLGVRTPQTVKTTISGPTKIGAGTTMRMLTARMVSKTPMEEVIWSRRTLSTKTISTPL